MAVGVGSKITDGFSSGLVLAIYGDYAWVLFERDREPTTVLTMAINPLLSAERRDHFYPHVANVEEESQNTSVDDHFSPKVARGPNG